MKIASILFNQPLSGGGFNQSLSALRQMSRLCEGRFEFRIYCNSAENVTILKGLDLEAILIESGSLSGVEQLLLGNRPGRGLARRVNFISSIEKRMNRDGVDLVYFPAPNVISRLLMDIPYISTVWDLSYRDSPEFPEVRGGGRFESLEHYHRETLPKAILTLVDSELLAERIARRFGIDPARLLAMPFSPAPSLESEVEREYISVLDRYELSPGYIYYPAQFWSHKNHIRLLEAMVQLKKSASARELVFSGGDQGNLSHVKETAVKLGVSERVHFLGFVPAEHMAALYLGCAGVCMPSYFGPTNLPPLEAWTLKRPLLYAGIFREQTRDAAEYFDPDSVDSLVMALRCLDDKRRCQELVLAGTKRLEEIARERSAAEKVLLERLITFDERRRCWSSH